jgi:nucleotidyltransferase substrate binding protein (TIGR01987 family)
MGVTVLEFERALATLHEALQELSKVSKQTQLAQYRMIRDALVQRFEFSIELAWKTSAKVLGSSSTAAKPVIREMAQNSLISDVQKWFDFIEGRNKTSHAYDEDIAEQIVRIAQNFYPEAILLLERLKKK